MADMAMCWGMSIYLKDNSHVDIGRIASVMIMHHIFPESARTRARRQGAEAAVATHVNAIVSVALSVSYQCQFNPF
eukprot:4781118-Amphidinium_carterae.1